MAITTADALIVLPLSLAKLELRIPDAEKAHDALLTSQIVSAVEFVSKTSGVALADLPRAAVVASVRSQYNGGLEVKETAAAYAWMQPVRSYKAE